MPDTPVACVRTPENACEGTDQLDCRNPLNREGTFSVELRKLLTLKAVSDERVIEMDMDGRHTGDMLVHKDCDLSTCTRCYAPKTKIRPIACPSIRFVTGGTLRSW